jgi:RNA polymerase sigma factor (sigma-70 family)
MNRKLRKALQGLQDPNMENRRKVMKTFVEATYEIFIRCLYRNIGNVDECEDILQEVYTNIWENPSHLRNVENGGHFLKTVYLYYMRSPLRKAYTRINRSPNLDGQYRKRMIQPELEPSDVLDKEELNEALYRMINLLANREKTCIRLWLQGFSFWAIAREMKISVGAAKMLYYRTIKKLGDFFDDYNYK